MMIIIINFIKKWLISQIPNSNDLFFINGYLSESLDNKLKTLNAFSLGGLNFKGFDYRGIGPIVDNIYLGGNKFLPTGIGGSFFLTIKII